MTTFLVAWFFPSAVIVALAAGVWLGSRWRYSEGFDDGYDLARADRLERELATADALRAFGDITPAPEFYDCIERRWM